MVYNFFMNLPFTVEQFFGVFAKYNTSVWPSQLALYFMAAVVFYFVFKKHKYADKVIAAILAFYWLWMGIVYQILFFSAINPAAKIFGAVFVLQGLFFIYEGVYKRRLSFEFHKNFRSYTGLFLMLFGTIVYPLAGPALGHIYPNTPTFGLPCPTTIFTFGALLLATTARRYLIIIPFLWSLLGFTAAVSLGVTEDVSLLVAGVISLILFLFNKTALYKKKAFIPVVK